MRVMGTVNAKAQAAYRSRQVKAGARRLDVFISAGAASAIRDVAARDGVTQREALERIALQAVGAGQETESEKEDGCNE